MNNANNRPPLIVPGQTQLHVQHHPGPLVTPIQTTLQVGNTVQVKAFGGLSQLADLTTRVLAAVVQSDDAVRSSLLQNDTLVLDAVTRSCMAAAECVLINTTRRLTPEPQTSHEPDGANDA